MTRQIESVRTKFAVSTLVFSIALCAALVPTLASPAPTVSVSPAAQEVGAGATFSINIAVNPDGKGISTGQLFFAFNASVMQVNSVTAGNLLGPSPIPMGPFINNTAGTVEYSLARQGPTTPPTPAGTFATISLTIKGAALPGTYALDITSMNLANESIKPIAGIVINDGTVTVKDQTPPTYSNIQASPASPTTYAPGKTYTFNITVQDNVAVHTVLLQFDGVNSTYTTKAGSVYSFGFTGLAAGSHSYKWYMNDTSNNWNSTSSLSYVINKAATSVNLLLNGTDGNLTVDYGQAVNMSATLNISDTLTLYVDGVNSGSGTGSVVNVTTLGAGTHNITASYPGSQNYTASSETHWLTVRSPLRWDINQDCNVDYLDLGVLAAHWGESTSAPYPRYDINEDGTVNYLDLGVLGAHWGETC